MAVLNILAGCSGVQILGVSRAVQAQKNILYIFFL